MNAKIGSIVTATEEISDEGQLFAQPGDMGRVLDVQRDGAAVALTVAWASAPSVTTCYLDEDCSLAARA